LRSPDLSENTTSALEPYLVTPTVITMLSMVLLDTEFMFRVRVSTLTLLTDEIGVTDLAWPFLFLIRLSRKCTGTIRTEAMEDISIRYSAT